ncbi:MAG: guanylate kinase [Candidatus Omnitrophota bacterium]
MKKRKGKLFVVSAPSGSGKTTLCAKILNTRNIKISRSVSMTTRPPRGDEKNGRDYFFIDLANFKQMIKQRAFLEWAKVFDHFYGTPYRFIEETLSCGKNVLLNIDVQGALQIKRKMPQSILIYIVPPSMQELKMRLLKRNTEAMKEIKKRLEVAREELKKIKHYKYVIVNDNVRQATARLKDIINKELT